MEIEESIKHNLAGVRTLGYEHIHDTRLISLSTLEKALKMKMKVQEQSRVRLMVEAREKEREESQMVMHHSNKYREGESKSSRARPGPPSHLAAGENVHVHGTGRHARPLSPTSTTMTEKAGRGGPISVTQGVRPSSPWGRAGGSSGGGSTHGSAGSTLMGGMGKGGRGSPHMGSPVRPSSPMVSNRYTPRSDAPGRAPPSSDLIGSSRNMSELLERLQHEAQRVAEHDTAMEHDIQDAPALLFTLEGHTKAVTQVCFSYNNEELFSCGHDGAYSALARFPLPLL